MLSSAPLCLSLLLFLTLQSDALYYRTGACLPSRRGTLTVTVARGWNTNRYLSTNLYRYGSSSRYRYGSRYRYLWTTPSLYAKIIYGTTQRQTTPIRSTYPRWNARYYLGNVSTSYGLRTQLWSRNRYGRLSCLMSCTRYLKQGTNTFTCRSGTRGIQVSYTLNCNRCSCNPYRYTRKTG